MKQKIYIVKETKSENAELYRDISDVEKYMDDENFEVKSYFLDLSDWAAQEIADKVNKKYDYKDAESINLEYDADMQLTDEELKQAVEKYENSHDCDFSKYDQLKGIIDDMIQKKADKKKMQKMWILKGETWKGKPVSMVFLSSERMENYISDYNIKNVTILKYEIEFDSQAKDDIYREMRHYYDILDAEIICAQYNYLLDNTDLDKAVSLFRQYYDWDDSDYYDEMYRWIKKIADQKQEKSQM